MAPFLRKRYSTSPSAQPPGLVVPPPDSRTLSPASYSPLWLASSTVRLTTNPPSFSDESQLAAGVVGQVEAGAVSPSGNRAICVVMAPVMRMSSTHQPSSLMLSFQQVPEAQP